MSPINALHAARQDATHRLTVLLADENPSDRATLARLLHRQFGPRVGCRQTDDGPSALEIIRREKIDVVLIGHLPPDMDGLWLVRQVADLLPDTAIVLGVDPADDAAAARALEAGAHDCVFNQTFDGNDLERAVLQALRIKELRRRNAQVVKQLRRTHEESEHFVRALSHDMNANFMLLESSFRRLKESLEDSDQSELGQVIAHVEACLHESKRFLDDMVRLARSGSVDMEPGRVDLGKVVEAVLFEQRELLLGRGVEVNVRRPLPLLWCNPLRVKQIVTNLVRNALKHGCDPGHPRITISSIPEKHGGLAGRRLAVIRIHDNGPGIDPRWADDVFLPGRRLPKASEDGSGMGLAIVKKIAEHYGGSVRLDPNCRSGTTFEVALPILSDKLPDRRLEAGKTHIRGRRKSSTGHDGQHPELPPQPHQIFGRQLNRIRRD